MITQIYSIQTVQEALDCVDCGVDNIGIAAGTGSSSIPAAISFELGRQIFAAIGVRAKHVALTVADDESDIFPVIEELRPDILHICGNSYYVTPEFVQSAKRLQPNIEILQAIPMTGAEAVALAVYYAEFCDYLILDSVKAGIDGIGAAGITHDWSLSRRIMEETSHLDCKIILAGGLSPNNVADAIKAVKPYGVDSFTNTSTNGRKDKSLIQQFVINAQAAAKELGI